MSSSDRPSESAEKMFPGSTISFRPPARADRSTLEGLEADVLTEMEDAWRNGARKPAEHWLQKYPALAANGESAVRLIYEEVCLREELGEFVDAGEMYRRFPNWQHELEVLLDCHHLVQPEDVVASFPQPGQRLGELQLLYEIGRGGLGRVFLATQPSLSDRPLVVKLTPRSGEEHLSLARLQHTHIAPLYLVQDFPEENLRALCMPYLGGTSWSRLLEALRDRPPAQRSGRQIVECLTAAQLGAPAAPVAAGPTLRFLGRATYVQAVSWIGACLADALQYAHQRGLMHLDIKPSNVLLAGDGQPMLLDFHLARPMVDAESEPLDQLGGTRGYMSPEQLQAALGLREGRLAAVTLDGRSDIYSLGVLLYESLTGQLPPAETAASRRQMRQLNPTVSRGMEDVIHKCLAADPHGRYRDASALAADLRRHLADLPLQGVPNRSLRERWQKWRRRKLHALAVMGMALVALGVVVIAALAFVGDRLAEARSALIQGQQHLVAREYKPAIERLETGWNKIRWIPGRYDLKQALQTQLATAKRARLADTLHEMVERLRFVDSFETVPANKLRELNDGCETVWQARTRIAQLDSSQNNKESDRQLHNDLLDLAVLWASLRMRLAPADQTEQARRGAVELLNQAQELCGPGPILELARREYATASDAGAVGARPVPTPQTVWEHFAVGRWLYRSEQWAEAQREFQRAVDLEPNAFWPNFYLTLCAYRMERFEEALNSAYACVALSPKSAECFYNRALAHQALGQSEAALADFGRALAIDPYLAVATLHRGTLLTEMGRFVDARADLEAALAAGMDPAEVHYQMARLHLAEQDQAGALQSVHRALEHNANYAPALELQGRLDNRQ